MAGMPDIAKLHISAINHIGIVVKDVDKAVEHYWNKFAIGPWHILTLGPGFGEITFYGRPCPHAVKAATTHIGPLEIELLQPLWGDSPAQQFLAERGEGIQHLGIFVENLDQASRKMEQLGFKEMMAAYGMGPSGDGAIRYFDTQSSLGTLIELIKLPTELLPPENIYPGP